MLAGLVIYNQDKYGGKMVKMFWSRVKLCFFPLFSRIK